jgi:hypothetical protein
MGEDVAALVKARPGRRLRLLGRRVAVADELSQRGDLLRQRRVECLDRQRVAVGLRPELADAAVHRAHDAPHVRAQRARRPPRRCGEHQRGQSQHEAGERREPEEIDVDAEVFGEPRRAVERAKAERARHDEPQREPQHCVVRPLGADPSAVPCAGPVRAAADPRLAAASFSHATAALLRESW